MKVTAIHGKNTGSTKAVASMLLEEIKSFCPQAEISEYCVANGKPCIGCFSCFANGEASCPHYDEVHPLIASIEDADVVILDSPVYCMGISGALKSFLDHMGYRWFAHRPYPSMASKIGVAISTTGSMGGGSVAKALKKHFFGWSLAKSYRLAFAVFGTGWDDVKQAKKQKISRRVQKIARKIVKKAGSAKRGIFLRFILSIMKIVQKKNDWFPLDKAYWSTQGWI